MAKAEPKRLRWALWHATGRITTSGRRRTLHLDAAWPSADSLARAFGQLERLHFTT